MHNLGVSWQLPWGGVGWLVWEERHFSFCFCGWRLKATSMPALSVKFVQTWLSARVLDTHLIYQDRLVTRTLVTGFQHVFKVNRRAKHLVGLCILKSCSFAKLPCVSWPNLAPGGWRSGAEMILHPGDADIFITGIKIHSSSCVHLTQFFPKITFFWLLQN